MAATTREIAKGASYSWGAATLFFAAAVIALALAFEHIGGLAPCELCLWQRLAYYGSIPLLFLALVLVAAEQRGLAAALFLIVALAFLANAGLATYHTGVEWKYWPGPTTCSGGALAPLGTSSGQGVLGQLDSTRVIRCDEPAWVFLGLSMAGWNIIASLLLMAAALKAGMASSERHDA